MASPTSKGGQDSRGANAPLSVIYIAAMHQTCDPFTAHLIGWRSCDTHNLSSNVSPVQQSSPVIRDDLMGRLGRPSNRSVHTRLQTTNIGVNTRPKHKLLGFTESLYKISELDQCSLSWRKFKECVVNILQKQHTCARGNTNNYSMIVDGGFFNKLRT